jgi:hypothetical protein
MLSNRLQANVLSLTIRGLEYLARRSQTRRAISTRPGQFDDRNQTATTNSSAEGVSKRRTTSQAQSRAPGSEAAGAH